MENYSDHYRYRNRALLEDEDEEEALSLCDLPLTTRKTTITAENSNISSTTRGKSPPPPTTTPPSSDSPAEFFEFLTNLSSTSGIFQCSAEEVISSGQLLPFAPRRPPRPPHHSNTSTASSSSASVRIQTRRSSEPVREAKDTVTRCNSTKSIRPSRSLDYVRLNRNSSSSSGSRHGAEYSRSFGRNLSVGKEKGPGVGHGKSSIDPLSSSWEDNSYQKEANRLPWWLMLGLVRYPTDQVEIMKDVKNRRQYSRRNHNPATLVPAPPPPPPPPPEEEKPSLSGYDDIDHRRRSETGKHKSSNTNVPTSISKKNSSWRVLSVLSCKSHASVAVTTSFPSIPNMRAPKLL